MSVLTADSTLSEVRAAIASARTGAPLVVTTSGSTAAPKRVALDYSALLASAEASAERIGSGNWYLALPAGYIAGVNVVLRAELAGGQLLSQAEAGSFAAAAATLAEPRYTSVVPAQLATLAARAESTDPAEREAALAEWRALAGFACVLVGGQALPSELRATAEHHGVNVVASYGASETSGGCVYDGEPLRGVQLRLDADGALLIAGPMLARGYVDANGAIDAPRSAASFVELDGTRWYRSNDLAELRTAGS